MTSSARYARRMRKLLPALATAALLSAVATNAHAAVVPVTNVAELRAAITAAKAGDEIVLAAGTYAMGDIACSANGTSAAPIVVRAATPLTAKIELSGLEGFKVSGAHWHFEGLSIKGVCATDDACEHAFHVTGGASGFVLRKNVIVDFNAQLKANTTLGATPVTPHAGLVEYNELYDTHVRSTELPVTKLNIDTGDDWIVRGNYIHDFFRPTGVTYGAFMKSGGKRGLFERNLVVCKKDVAATGAQIGLSFGGGGTGNAFCAPAFSAGVPCLVEHEGGTMRNNVIASCSDVGIYLNRSKATKLLHNTLAGTTGIDFRFETSSGEARGNLLSGEIRARNGAMAPTVSDGLIVTDAELGAMFVGPLVGDLRKKGDLAKLLGKAPARTDVPDDWCARARSAPYDIGALQHSLGDCASTTPPSGGAGAPDGGAGPGDGGGGPTGGGASTDGGGGAPTPSPGAGPDGDAGSEAGESGCNVGVGAVGSSRALLVALASVFGLGLCRRRRALGR